MNFRQKHKENQKLIQLYDAFLPYCENWSDKSKLLCEIAELIKQNEFIEKMPYAETQQEIGTYFITR